LLRRTATLRPWFPLKTLITGAPYEVQTYFPSGADCRGGPLGQPLAGANGDKSERPAGTGSFASTVVVNMNASLGGYNAADA